MNFEPCTTYKVSIEVKSYEMIYCTEPLITERKFTTNDRGTVLHFIKIIYFYIILTSCTYYLNVSILFILAAPKSVKNVHFSNYEGSFWNAQLRWSPPDTDSCIFRYM